MDIERTSKTIVEIFTDRGLFIISDPENKDPYLEDENDPYIQSCLTEVKDEQWIKILLCDDHAALEEIRSYMDGRHTGRAVLLLLFAGLFSLKSPRKMPLKARR